jgi:hypothetical protein
MYSLISFIVEQDTKALLIVAAGVAIGASRFGFL